jgi:sulfur relay protein TusB/DsrH
MADYVIIESRDPFDCAAVTKNYELCKSLAQNGDDVTLFFVQNGVLTTREGKFKTTMEDLNTSGVKLMADVYSLQTRGIKEDQLIAGTKSADLELIVDALAASKKVIWN